MNLTSKCFAAILCVGAVMLSFSARETAAEPVQPLLRLEAKIPLGDVRGRIDHMAIDVNRGRLFVAELGSDAVAVVDLKERKVIKVIAGLKEPQGVGTQSSVDRIAAQAAEPRAAHKQ